MKRPSWWLPLAAAIAAIVLRLPLLRAGEAFFGGDEAIVGLMARHVRDLPVFLWGQDYHGVPEVYLVAPVFALFGAGVIQLKAVTLGLWAVAVALSTRLGQRWYGNLGGLVTGAILATGSPALVYWSLSGSAEVAWLTLIFAGGLLAYQDSIESPSRPLNPLIFIGSGFALWVHPVAQAFVAALAAVAASRTAWWRERGWAGVPDLVRGRPLTGAARVIAVSLHVLLAAAAVTFVFTAHQQKVLRVLTDLAVVTIVFHALTGAFVPRRRALSALGWFALGLAPVALHVARGGQPGVTWPLHSFREMPWFIRTLAHDALPIFAGVKNLISDWLVPWWYALGFVGALFVHIVVNARATAGIFTGRRVAPSAAFAIVAGAALFAILGPGGMFRDLHSTRDLMPFFGLAALSAASGVRWIWDRSPRLGVLLAAACVCGFLAEDARWLLDQQPDHADQRFIACLEAKGIHTATAGEEIAYRLTFLSAEQLIVNPESNPRYRPYTTRVRANPSHVFIETIDRRSSSTPAGEVICASPNLEAVAR